MRLTRTVAPDPIVTVDQWVKMHSKIEIDFEDAWLTAVLIPTAHRYCEHYCQKSFGEQTWKLTDWRFPCKLDMPPLISVTSIKYYKDGVQHVLSPDDYQVQDGTPGKIIYLNLPSIDSRPDAVEVVYVLGEEPPENVVWAACVLVEHYYVHRGLVTSDGLNEVPWSAHSALDEQCWGNYA